jgi:hypothetical protein
MFSKESTLTLLKTKAGQLCLPNLSKQIFFLSERHALDWTMDALLTQSRMRISHRLIQQPIKTPMGSHGDTQVVINDIILVGQLDQRTILRVGNVSANFLTKEKTLRYLSDYSLESLVILKKKIAHQLNIEIDAMYYSFFASAFEPFAIEMIEAFQNKAEQEKGIKIEAISFGNLLQFQTMRMDENDKRRYLRLMRGSYNELKQHTSAMPWIN